MTLRATAAAVLAATALMGIAAATATEASATPVPQPQSVTAETRAAAARAASAPDTLATLSRFFAREGRIAPDAARPRIEGEPIPVNHLSPDFVAGQAGAPVARLEFLAGKAVAADGQQAVLWTARTGEGWQVVNIATGDDEFRYARSGEEKLPGGTVFREPQIDAWYVAGGGRVLPLDEDAVAAVGSGGTSLAAYRARVTRAYGDKLPGSAYAERGMAGGFAEPVSAGGGVPVGGIAAGALALAGVGALTLARRRTPAGA
ncbi:hypothetical protein ACFV9E_39175 [Streptomyces sp. NPDC059835]|uniref:hypothetical protein n=1 Tax=Streptomyces sp. NPDC059835 TaxID=3346967 RepID=UPI0036680E22